MQGMILFHPASFNHLLQLNFNFFRMVERAQNLAIFIPALALHQQAIWLHIHLQGIVKFKKIPVPRVPASTVQLAYPI